MAADVWRSSYPQLNKDVKCFNMHCCLLKEMPLAGLQTSTRQWAGQNRATDTNGIDWNTTGLGSTVVYNSETA